VESFDTWITRKYIEWRGDKVGREGSVSAFARWVGIDQSNMSYWMQGKNKPNEARTINALVGRFGGEVYDVLGLTPAIDAENDGDIREVIELMKSMPPETQREVVFAVRAMAVQLGYKVVKTKQ
jgi:hypothetical protein